MVNLIVLKTLVLLVYIIITNVVIAYAFGLVSEKSDLRLFSGVSILLVYTIFSYVFLRGLYHFNSLTFKRCLNRIMKAILFSKN